MQAVYLRNNIRYFLKVAENQKISCEKYSMFFRDASNGSAAAEFILYAAYTGILAIQALFDRFTHVDLSVFSLQNTLKVPFSVSSE